MGKYRKKPVVIEARQYPGHSIEGVDNLMAFEEWLEPIAKAAGRWPLKYVGQSLIIPTLEGDHEAKPGDYIIQGVQGEIYPCKPDIFEATYDVVATLASIPHSDAGQINWKAEWEAASLSSIRYRKALDRICDLGCCGGKGSLQKALDIAVSAVSSTPSPTSSVQEGAQSKDRLILEAIKVVTATATDACKGLSRILWLTRQAGVTESYADLRKDQRVAVLSDPIAPMEERKAILAALAQEAATK